jgi:glycosyltransferase involved in cell wall biosynthesis/predicted TPR repeat methyltransferase
MFGFINNIRRVDRERTLSLAERAARARDWHEAARLYRESLDARPEDGAIWVQYGHALKESGDRLQAEEAYRRSLALDPDLADTHLQLGHVLKLQGRLDEAAAAYAQALALAPAMRDAARELTALGWSPLRVQRAQREARRPPRDKTQGKIARTILFDVSDLLEYFQRARTPTGIQRVQISVISRVLHNAEISAKSAIVCFTTNDDFWIEIPPHLFLELAALAVSSGPINDPVWQDALVELNTNLDDGVAIEFAGGETLINLGTSWWLTNYFLMVRYAKAKFGVRYVPFIHDLIPIITPEHCTKELTQDFINWIIGVFFHADGYLVNSKATAGDLKRVANLLGHAIAEPRVVRLDGCFDLLSANDLSREAAAAAVLDMPKAPFVLFVGTIESRKNHLLAFNLWLELIRKRGERKTPTLICVGNDGWMTEAAMARLSASDQLQRRVRIVRKVSDADLARLYRECLFTIYPSSYEGWGLPVTEALSFGKAVVTTAMSSLPEAGGEFADYFDPQSVRDMSQKVERLIDDPEYRRSREAKIKAEFKSRSWADIAEEIVGQAVAAAHEQPQRTLEDREHWVWPLPAETGRYYSLARNHETSIWPGMIGGEMYRMGSLWCEPENWGTWTKEGLARLAFNPPADDVARVLYLGLLGPPLIKTRYCVRLLDGVASSRQGELDPDETRWIVINIPGQALPNGSVHIGIDITHTADLGEVTEGEGRRVVGIGVRGFYLCRADDLFARLRFLEALQTNQLEEIMGRPDESLGFFDHEPSPPGDGSRDLRRQACSDRPEVNETITRQQVIEGFRVFFGRDPESEAMVEAFVAEKWDLWRFLRILAESPEGLRYRLDQGLAAFVDYRPGRIDVDVQPEENAKLVAVTRATWSALGVADPFWSVLTVSDYRAGTLDEARREDFYATGAAELEDLTTACRRNKIDVDPGCTLLELGCGVGRIGEHFARSYARYIGVDMSAPHLEIARERIASRGMTNTTLLTLDEFLRDDGPSFDLFYSVLALQHSPPPVMLMVLNACFARLLPGGCAFFQLPCHLYDYEFKLTDYFSRKPDDPIEMHALPQARVFRALAENGMVPVEVFPYPRIGPIGFSYAFLASKPSG